MLTDRDYEVLSEYMDNALNDSERVALESRLSAEAELSRELEALRATVALVKALPARTAPRNFTLDARMARRPVSRQILLSPTFYSAASAIAAVFLIGFSLLLLTENAAPTALVGQQAASLRQEQDIALAASETAILKASDGSIGEIATTELAPPQPLSIALPSQTVDNFSALTGAGGENAVNDSIPADQAGQVQSEAQANSPQPAESSIAAAQAAPSVSNTTTPSQGALSFSSPAQGSTLEEFNTQTTTDQGFVAQSDEAAFAATPPADLQRTAITPTAEATLTPTMTPSATMTQTPAPQTTVLRDDAQAPAPVNTAVLTLGMGTLLLAASVILYLRSRRRS